MQPMEPLGFALTLIFRFLQVLQPVRVLMWTRLDARADCRSGKRAAGVDGAGDSSSKTLDTRLLSVIFDDQVEIDKFAS